MVCKWRENMFIQNIGTPHPQNLWRWSNFCWLLILNKFDLTSWVWSSKSTLLLYPTRAMTVHMMCGSGHYGTGLSVMLIIPICFPPSCGMLKRLSSMMALYNTVYITFLTFKHMLHSKNSHPMWNLFWWLCLLTSHVFHHLAQQKATLSLHP